MLKSPIDAVVDEFTAWYHCDDDVLLHWDEPDFMASRSAETAARLIDDVAPDHLAELSTLLRTLRDDPRSSLHARLADQTLMSFTDAGLWPVFRKLMDDMVAAIEERRRDPR